MSSRRHRQTTAPETPGATTDPVVILSRYRGPSTSGNGGYTCGRLAAYVDGVAEVTLRRPPPLDRALTVRRGPDGVALVNTGAEPGRAEAVLLDEAGSELRRILLNAALAPGAKQLALLDQAFAGLRGTAVLIATTQPSAAVPAG